MYRKKGWTSEKGNPSILLSIGILLFWCADYKYENY